MPPRCLVSVRLKRLDSIRQKLAREYANFKLGGLEDIIGIRVVCESFHAARDLVASIHALDQFYRLKDYMSEHRNGYRAAHCIMQFNQPLSEDRDINVRFEIQIRTHYQHQWAIWSESLGEDVKAGLGTEAEHSSLLDLSTKIEAWENDNPHAIQSQLPAYSDSPRLTVAWKAKRMPILNSFVDVGAAVKRLNYLEIKNPASRYNALLLVGVANPKEARDVLRRTHPLYTVSHVPSPEHWMPPES